MPGSPHRASTGERCAQRTATVRKSAEAALAEVDREIVSAATPPPPCPPSAASNSELPQGRPLAFLVLNSDLCY